jgi:hypothetical protein
MAKASVVRAGTQDEGPRSLKIGLGFWAVAVALVVAGLVWLGPTETLDINSRDFFPLPAGFGFAAAAFGTFYLGRGVLFLLRFGKYGESTLEAGNAMLGKTFKGKIRTPDDLAAQGPFSLRLLCVHQTKGANDYDDNGGSNGIVTTQLWEAVATAPAATRSSAGIPFEFSIPKDGLRSLSRPFAQGHNIKWTLHVAAPLTGLDYSATFPVQVGGAGEGSQRERASAQQAPFAGQMKPEQSWMRIARFVAPVLGVLFFGAGSYATIGQLFHGGIPLTGKIVAVNMPSVDVALDEGGTVKIARVTKNHAWRVDEPVRVSCVEEGNTLRSCRMDTGVDRWIDGVGTLIVGVLLLLLSAWLWRRYLMYRRWMTMRTE